MRVHLIQKNINDKDFLRHLRLAQDEGAELACLGELSNSGCLYNGGEVVSFDYLLASLAEIKIPIMMGYPHQRDNHLFNSYIYYHNSNYQIYDKINLFEPMNEPVVYKAGEELKIFDTVLGKIGVVICYDLRFPELFKRLKEIGAEKIFVPAAFPRVRIDDWRRLLVERASENKVCIVGINSVGSDGRNEFGGSTMIVNPDGKITAQTDEINEQVIKAEL